jgi:hypothetical protein
MNDGLVEPYKTAAMSVNVTFQLDKVDGVTEVLHVGGDGVAFTSGTVGRQSRRWCVRGRRRCRRWVRR